MAALIRRALIKVLIGGGTATVLGVGANCRLFGRDKMAKQDVDYQDSPKGLQMCATCSLFEWLVQRLRDSRLMALLGASRPPIGWLAALRSHYLAVPGRLHRRYHSMVGCQTKAYRRVAFFF